MPEYQRIAVLCFSENFISSVNVIYLRETWHFWRIKRDSHTNLHLTCHAVCQPQLITNSEYKHTHKNPWPIDDISKIELFEQKGQKMAEEKSSCSVLASKNKYRYERKQTAWNSYSGDDCAHRSESKQKCSFFSSCFRIIFTVDLYIDVLGVYTTYINSSLSPLRISTVCSRYRP